MDKFTFQPYGSTEGDTIFDSSYTEPGTEVETRKQLSYPLYQIKEWVNSLATTLGSSDTTVKFRVSESGVLAYSTDGEHYSAINVSGEGHGMPGGGTTGQALIKADDDPDSYSFEWASFTALPAGQSDNYVPIGDSEALAGISWTPLKTVASQSILGSGNIDVLVSGTTVKTVNGKSIVGSGDITTTNTYSNIAVSGTPVALETFNSWDTEERYGYKLTVSVSGLTTNSLILSLVATDTLMESIAPIVSTGTNTLILYTSDNTALSGTIYSLVSQEV